MAASPLRERTAQTKAQISYGDLHRYLYARTAVRPIRIEDLRRKVREFQQANILRREKSQSSTKHSSTALHLGTPRLTSIGQIRKPTYNAKLSRALESFPEEVQLCVSSVPGVVYGVCAKTHIPIGTWIGPYEGSKVTTGSTWLGKDSSYMWEVFHQNRLAFYVDGSNEDTSSWMRFINCARNSTEQNLYAFQYCGNIYYRAFKEITPGTELLVWYDDIYPQFMGVPLEFKDLGSMETEEINANIPSKTNSDAMHFFEISPNTSPCSSVESSLNYDQAYPISTPSEQQLVIARNDDAILSRDNDEIEPPFKRMRKTSSPFEVSSGSKSKPATVQEAVADPSYHKVSSSNDFSGGDFSMVEATEEEHKEEDTGLGVFRCGQCDKVFAQKSVLQMHVCTRTPNKPFQCGFCGNAFPNPNELRVHASAHCNEKPFKCGYCFRSFSGATTLNNHIRTHTGEKPFICEKCGKTFSQGSQLSKHQRLSSCYKHAEDITHEVI